MSEDSVFGMADKVEAEVVRNGEVLKEDKPRAVSIDDPTEIKKEI